MQGSRVRPNFSMVRLTKIRGRTYAVRDKKKSPRLKVSLWFNNRHTLGSYRGLNLSEIVKGGHPPLIGHGPDIPVSVCTFGNACAAIEMRAVLPT